MKIRELKEKDADGMLLWMHDDKTKDIFIKNFYNYNEKDVLNFINYKNDKYNINYACVDDEDKYLGTISLKNIDYDNLNAELAISFIKDAQGTGAAQFAMNEILKIGFNILKLKKIYLNVLSSNIRAINFYKKMGFNEEGIFKNHVKKNNKYIDLMWFAIENSFFKGV